MRPEINIHPLDLQPDIAIGIKLNPSVVKGNVFISTYTTLDQAKTNLISLILTNEGERIMHPTFGVGMPKLLFEPIDNSFINKIKEKIRTKVATWLPYVNIIDIKVDVNLNSNLITLSTEFSLQGNKFDTDTVVLELSLPPA